MNLTLLVLSIIVLVLISCNARMRGEWGSYFDEPESKLCGQILRF